MTKQGLIQTAKEYTEEKLCILEEWLDATDEKREAIEERLESEYGMDFSETDNEM